MSDLDARVAALKPCPFCGSAADVDNNFGREYWVQCTNLKCGSTDGKLYTSAAEAKERWNIRAVPQKPALHEPVAIARVIETDDFAAEVAWILNPCPPGTLLYEGPQLQGRAKPATVDSDDIYAEDKAVDSFASRMKWKLAKARERGKYGWQDKNWTPEEISQALREHVAKGDPVDVANYCMFLAARNEPITEPAQEEITDAEILTAAGDWAVSLMGPVHLLRICRQVFNFRASKGEKT